MAAVFDRVGDQTVYVGVHTNILQLRPGWHIRGTFPPSDDGLLLGAETARRHGWQIGQQVSLPGLKDRSGTVTGILEPTHGADDTFIHLRLGGAQRLFHHPQELTHILVRLKDPNALDQAVRQLRGCDAGLSMNVVPLAHMFHTIQSLVNSTRLLLGSVAIIALLVAGTGVSNTVLMAVVERRREIGVLRAIGATRANVFRLVWLETLQTCLAGSVLGVVVAFLASRSLETWVRSRLPFSPTDTLIGWEWWMVASCLGAALVLGSVASFLPAWRAASLPPMAAIRASGGRA
jgi:putative ABC transport system permease protein